MGSASVGVGGLIPQDSRNVFGTADFVGDNRVVFDIGGNRYRLIVHVAHKRKGVLIKFIGAHAGDGTINAETLVRPYHLDRER